MLSRSFSTGGGALNQIPKEVTGIDYFKAIVTIACEEERKKSEATKLTTTGKKVLCHLCGGETYRKLVQLRAGDEGFNTVQECIKCHNKLVVG